MLSISQLPQHHQQQQQQQQFDHINNHLHHSANNQHSSPNPYIFDSDYVPDLTSTFSGLVSGFV